MYAVHLVLNVHTLKPVKNHIGGVMVSVLRLALNNNHSLTH